jgi:hypothetical protein
VTAAEVFRRILGSLDSAGIPYMLTGSFASSYHGTPRATQDIDLVIAPERAQLRRLGGPGQRLESRSHHTAVAAVQPDRVRSAHGGGVEGMRVPIATAEDVVLAKLEWAKLGESARQIEDAAGILRARSAELDLSYLKRWVRELGIEREWVAARRMSSAS